MNEELGNVGSFVGEQGKIYELYIDKNNGLLHIIYNNVEQEEILHVVARVEETSAGIDATLISGCEKVWKSLKKRLISILSLHAPAVINCHFGFKFKNIWQMYFASYLDEGSSYQKQ